MASNSSSQFLINLPTRLTTYHHILPILYMYTLHLDNHLQQTPSSQLIRYNEDLPYNHLSKQPFNTFRYDNMKLQLSKLKSQCERNLLEAFQTSARDFESWLKTKKELVQNYGEVSGNRDAAKHKLENIQVEIVCLPLTSISYE